jgi:hypothetical protein
LQPAQGKLIFGLRWGYMDGTEIGDDK